MATELRVYTYAVLKEVETNSKEELRALILERVTGVTMGYIDPVSDQNLAQLSEFRRFEMLFVLLKVFTSNTKIWVDNFVCMFKLATTPLLKREKFIAAGDCQKIEINPGLWVFIKYNIKSGHNEKVLTVSLNVFIVMDMQIDSFSVMLSK